MKIRRCLTIDTAEFTPEEAAQEIILHLEREGCIGLNEEAAEREAKLLLVPKIENQERIILRISSQDARICASAAATH